MFENVSYFDEKKKVVGLLFFLSNFVRKVENMKNRNLQNFIKDSQSTRNASVLSPSAPTSQMCTGYSSSELTRTRFVDQVISDKTLAVVEKSIMLLLLQHGLRISEVLSISASSFIGVNTLLIKGLKHSENRVIVNPLYCKELFQYVSGVGCLSVDFNRYYIYRLMKARNIQCAGLNSNKIAVTHAGRHLTLQNLKSNNLSADDIQKYIGHKNINSQNNYTTSKNGKK